MEAFSKLKYGTLWSCFVPRALGFEHSRNVRRADPAQGLSTSLLAFCLYVCFLLFDGGSLALRGVELELMGNLEEF